MSSDLKLLVTLSAQAASGIENALLHESLLQEEVIRAAHERDLEAAARIQANTLPRRDPLFPDHPQVDVYATVEPAKEVGGDFFDAFALDGQHICILVGDVAGKGMPAALFMVRAITLLRMSLTGADSFESVLPTVNQLLCENNEEFMFVTLFLG